jgi:phage recombination protein Bet
MTTEVVKKAEVAPAKVSVMNSLAAKLECEPAKLMPMLKKTAFATCKTDEEFMAMCMVANTYGLNPILKEVYAFPAKGGQVVPIVGVDGWIKLMNSNPAFDGLEFEETQDSCTAIVYRKDRSHPIKATEWLSECMGNTEPWKRWPKRMLRHKAMIQAARIAFGFAGIYDEDEAARIASVDAVIGDSPLEDGEKAHRTPQDALRAKLGLKSGKESAKGADAPETPSRASDAIPAKDGELPLGEGIQDDVPL